MRKDKVSRKKNQPTIMIYMAQSETPLQSVCMKKSIKMNVWVEFIIEWNLHER